MSGVCCSIQLKTGVLTIGILTAILPLITIIIINTEANVLNELNIFAMITTPLFLETLASILLMTGVIMNRWELMMPWLISTCMLLYMMLHFQSMLWMLLVHGEPKALILIIGIILVSLLMGLFVYFLLVVYRYAKDVRNAILTAV